MAFARVPDRCHPGRGDGEALRPGWLAQPVSAASSVALAAGAVVVARGVRGGGAPAVAGRLLALALGVNAIGSAGFHGPGDHTSRVLHDMSLWSVAALCGAGAAAGLLRAPAVTARALRTPAVLVLAGAAAARLSRTGGPLCRPSSYWQGHAVWHVLAAAGVTVAGRRLFGGVGHLPD